MSATQSNQSIGYTPPAVNPLRAIFRTLSGYSLWAILTGILLILLIYPIILTVRGAVVERAADGTDHYTLKHIGIALSDPSIRECLYNSVKMAMTTTTLCILIAVPDRKSVV